VSKDFISRKEINKEQMIKITYLPFNESIWLQ